MMNHTHTGQVPPRRLPAPPMQAAQTHATPTPYPWDDITPIEPLADELDDDKWLADMALTVIAWSAFIFASGFGLGYLSHLLG